MTGRPLERLQPGVRDRLRGHRRPSEHRDALALLRSPGALAPADLTPLLTPVPAGQTRPA